MQLKDIRQELNNGLHRELIEAIVIALNDRGIVSNEDNGAKCSKLMFRALSDDYLREKGYKGGELGKTGKHDKYHGHISALYDTQRISYEEADEYLDEVRRRAPI